MSMLPYSKHYTLGTEALPYFIEDEAPSQHSYNECFTAGPEDMPYFMEDAAPSEESYNEYFTPGQEEVPHSFEETARCMTPYFHDDGVGLGIMVPDYSDYHDTTPALYTYQPEVLPPSLSLAQPDSTPAGRSYWPGEYSHLEDFYFYEDSPEREESEVAETPVWPGEESSSDFDPLGPPPRSPIDPRYLNEDDNLTSLFNVYEGWEEQLINSYATGSVEEEEEECTFDHRASFFDGIAYSANPPLYRPEKRSYYEQNTDSTRKANSRPKANLADRFRDEYLSRCFAQVESVTSGNITHVLCAAKVAQVAEVAHIDELAPRDSGGSLVKRCSNKAVSRKRFSQMLKRTGRKWMSLAKQRLSV